MKTMKRLSCFVLVVVMCLCVAIPAFAATPDENIADVSSVVYYYKVVASSGANMRSGPSTSYGIVASFANGTYLYYIGYTSGSDGYRWYHLGHYDTTGWIRGDLVEYSGYYTGT